MPEDSPPASDEEALVEVGLTPNEAKVYLALLGLGEGSVGEITDRVKLHRSTVYDALERLTHKGVASYILKNDTKVFAASDPEDLIGLLKEKELKIKAILPKLKLEKSLAAKDKTSAQVFEGVTSLRAAAYSLLDRGEPIVVYGLPKITPDIIKYFINDFHRQRIEKKIEMRHIYNEDAKDRIDYLNSLPLTEAKYLPERYSTPVSTMVCGDTVLIINWAKPLTFIQIKNRTLADTYRNYFEVLYKAAT